MEMKTKKTNRKQKKRMGNKKDFFMVKGALEVKITF